MWPPGAAGSRSTATVTRGAGCIWLSAWMKGPSLIDWRSTKDQPVGFASSYLDVNVIDLCNLGVTQSYRRRGIDQALIATRLADGASRGATTAVSAPSREGWRSSKHSDYAGCRSSPTHASTSQSDGCGRRSEIFVSIRSVVARVHLGTGSSIPARRAQTKCKGWLQKLPASGQRKSTLHRRVVSRSAHDAGLPGGVRSGR
jgi:hypothetical protein